MLDMFQIQDARLEQRSKQNHCVADDTPTGQLLKLKGVTSYKWRLQRKQMLMQSVTTAGRFRWWDNCSVGPARGTAVSGSHAGRYTRGGLVRETVSPMKSFKLTFEKLSGLPIDVGATAMAGSQKGRIGICQERTELSQS